jgi:hypothetical protein
MPLPEIPAAPPSPRPFPFGGGEEPSERFDRQIDTIKSPDSAPSAGGGGGATPEPFDLSFTAGGSPSDLTPTMRPGTINSVIPSNYLSIPDFSDTGTFYFVLSVTALNGQIVSATVALNGSAPAGIPVTMGVPPTAFDFLIGVVQDGVWYRSAPAGSFTAVPFETFRAGITSPPPGTLPYDIYYSWGVT